jgi:hypothetical protein
MSLNERVAALEAALFTAQFEGAVIREVAGHTQCARFDAAIGRLTDSVIGLRDEIGYR